ncbi:SpoIIE family protein phosphatase [Leptolyngbyaceae cyanobacterium UHCC 1019]
MKLVKPGRNLMNHLNYPQKFALISSLFALPIILLTYLLFSEFQSKVDFTQKELYGTQYLRPLRRLLENTLKANIENDRTKDTNKISNQIIESKSKIALDVNKLKQLDQKFGNNLGTTSLLKNIQYASDQLDNQVNLNSQSASTNYHQLLYQLEDLWLQVGDQSNLILDPDLDTYYLMDAVLLSLPEIQRNLAEIQMISEKESAQKVISPLAQAQLITLKDKLKQLNTHLSGKMTIALNNNPSGNLRPILLRQLQQLNRTVEHLTKQMNTLSRDRGSLQAKTYSDLSAKSLQQSFILWDKTVQELDFLLEKRIDGFAHKQYWTTVFILIVLAIAAYLFICFYHGMMQVVQSLKTASQRMVDGNFKDAVTLLSQDELADVVKSFNTVADVLREAEAKYRGIFENSVEGIFQTTPNGTYLIANPMLAKIYGYNTAEDLINNMTNIGEQLYVDRDRRTEFAQLIEHHGKVSGFESQIYCKDGSIIWISESARAIYDDQKDITGYEGTVEDITRRKHAEAEVMQLTQQLQDENLRMGAELNVTRRLQKMLMPAEAELEAIIGLDIAGFMEPAAEVGGDYYDVIQHDGKVSISIGDVTGHGLESGMVMIMAQMAVRTLLVNGEMNSAKFLNSVNRALYENTKRMRSLKNMSLALLEYKAGDLYLTGQHEELIVVRRDGQLEHIDTLDLGFPLALEADISSFIAEVKVHLYSGDIAVLYTDGISEAMNTQNSQYGLEKMYEVLKQYRDRSAQEIRQAVIADLMQHIGKQKVFDDITLLIMKQK